ncbi:MAG: flagellar basal body P-ring formation chaperone FlgA [Candidatus Omnitrophica bacterium]|nr:flagellar basal body P-ring formation chaperone FlgA [Candidatus Omnitrophota bacterium]MCM8827578.1 flagellar basal body P-ring formation chaperone FlgA [Candidatus Omnitrophota bacterium]
MGNCRFILGLFLLLLLISPMGIAQKNTISYQELFNICWQHIIREVDYPPEKLIFNLKQDFSEIELPYGEVEYKVWGKVDREKLGRVPLKVDIYLDGNLYRSIYTLVELDIKEIAFVTNRWIRRGELFSQDNIISKEMSRSSLPPNAIKDFKELEGKVSKVALGEGRVVTYNHIDERALIEKNQRVNLIVITPSLKVETKGIALVDGRAGAIIKVKNIDTGKIIYGEVKDKDTVVVSVP